MTRDQELAAAVLASSSTPAGRAQLERGEVSAELATAARRYAAQAAAGERWLRGLTPALRHYATSAEALSITLAGAAPTVDQLAAAAGRSRTATHAAIVRLRRLGLWPPGSPASDKTPHHDPPARP